MSSNLLPKGYKEWIPRVSELVEFAKPFKGTNGEYRYLEWLKKNNIEERDYTRGSQEIGDYIHQCMEDYLENREIDYANPLAIENNEEISNGLYWLAENIERKYEHIETEMYINYNDEYQGSVDLIVWNQNKEWVLEIEVKDYKTWGAVKKRFNLNNKLTFSTDKVKKVTIQMNLYRLGIENMLPNCKVVKLSVVVIHKDWAKEKVCKIMEDREVESLIEEFKISKLLF